MKMKFKQRFDGEKKSNLMCKYKCLDRICVYKCMFVWFTFNVMLAPMYLKIHSDSPTTNTRSIVYNSSLLCVFSLCCTSVEKDKTYQT